MEQICQGYLLKSLIKRQIQKRFDALTPFRGLAEARDGWIRFVREAFGLSQAQLAKLTGRSRATLQQIESREKTGSVTLASLREIANSLDCDLVYAIVPRRPIEEILKERARKRAAVLLRNAIVHMTLEDQAVIESFDERLEALAEELLKKGDVW